MGLDDKFLKHSIALGSSMEAWGYESFGPFELYIKRSSLSSASATDWFETKEICQKMFVLTPGSHKPITLRQKPICPSQISSCLTTNGTLTDVDEYFSYYFFTLSVLPLARSGWVWLKNFKLYCVVLNLSSACCQITQKKLRSRDLNPGQLGVKRVRFRCVVPLPTLTKT